MDIFTLMAKLSLDTGEYTKGISDAQKGLRGLSGKLSSSLKTVGKTVGVAIAAAATGVAALTKSAVSAYGEYEQLVGGVETLFKESASAVMGYADMAYKTAGMSANQYMETATSFAASLIASLGGDTEKAAQYADRAVIQMSDNANKMGSDIELIQNAYQGFAKQNYSMLDNLKLGYGGTKTEMERLITDAEALDSSFKATRDSNGDLAMSYADIVDAIQIVQDNMGITGTTAKEAEQTISGSLSMVKASWENLLTAMASGNGFQEQMDALVSSASSALNNILPVVENFLIGFGDLMKQVGPIIVEKLPGIIEEVMPSLLDAAVQIVGALAEALPGILEAIVTVVGGLVDSISAYLNERWPVIGQAFDGMVSVISTAFSAISDFWTNTLQPVFASIWSYITDQFAPGVSGAWSNNIVPVIQTAMSAISGFWESILKPAFQRIRDFVVTVIVPAFKENWPKIQDVVDRVFNTVKNLWNTILKPAFEGIRDFMVDTLLPAFQTVWEQGIQPLIEAVFAVIVATWEGVLYPAFVAIDDFLNNTLLPTFKTVWEENVQPVVENVFTAIEGFWNSILKPAFDAIVDFLENTMVPIYQNVFETTIKPLVESVFNAIQGFWENTLRPAFEEINSFLNDTLWPTFETVWQNNVQPLVDTVFAAIKGFWDDILHPVFEAIDSALEGTGTTWQEVFDLLSSKADTVFSAINGFMNTHLKPVFDWINQTFTPVFAAVQDAIGALGSWLSDVFTGNWESAWNGIVNGFGSIWGKITGLLSGPINAVIDMINSMIGAVEGAINSVVRGINKALSIKIPAKTFNIFGQEFGFPGWSWSANLSTVSWGRIAHVGGGGGAWNGRPGRFAEGGILANGLAYVGEFGPELLRVQSGVATVTPAESNPYAGLENAIERAVADRLDTIIKKISERMNVVLDTGALVGGIAPEMNDELERITAWSGGGRA